jgi:hypothetical protein
VLGLEKRPRRQPSRSTCALSAPSSSVKTCQSMSLPRRMWPVLTDPMSHSSVQVTERYILAFRTESTGHEFLPR